MALPIVDGGGSAATLKTTLSSGAHVPHHHVDSSALPTGAATAAHQVTQNAALDDVVTAAEAAQTAVEALIGDDQLTNFGSGLMTFSVAANAAAAAITPAPAAGKKLAIERVEFFETDAGAGTGDGKLAANDLLIVQLQEETSATVLFRRALRISAAGDQQNRTFEIVCPTPIKLPTADKKLFLRFYAYDNGGVAKNRNLTGQCNVWYRNAD